MSNATKRKTIQGIKDFLIEIGSESQLISKEYENNHTPLKFICSCGKTFEKDFTTIQQQKSCRCRECSAKKGWKLRRSNDYVSNIEKTLLEHEFIPLMDLSTIRKKEKILVKNKDGYIGRITVRNIELGQSFSVFSKRFNGDNLLYNLNNFCKINDFKTKVETISKEPIISRSSCNIRIECICECGEKYITSIGDLTTQNRAFCKKCRKSQSLNERKVKEELNKYNIKYTEQKIFDDCRGDKTNYPLPFDFYLDNYNIIIETDGEGHFSPIRFRGISNERALKTFNITKYNDNLKNIYCKTKKIKLIRIPYFEIKNDKYKKIIQSIIN